MNLLLFLLVVNPVNQTVIFKPAVMREPIMAESLNIILKEIKTEIEIIKTDLRSRQNIDFELYHLNKKQKLLWFYYQELQKKFKRDREFLIKKGVGQKFLSRVDSVEDGIAQKMNQLKSALDDHKFDDALTLLQEAMPTPQPVDSNPLYRRPETREPIAPTPQGKSLRVGGEPIPEDTMETIDIQITPLIKTLAQDLNYDPRKIYEYVKNNIAYHPYFGSMKGSLGTLYEKSGNDCDQASLLMALLRASEIPSRYQRGLIYLSVEDALKLFGVLEPKRIQEVLIMTGVPHQVYTSGGNIIGFDIEFFWVSAYLPIKHYMGIPTGDTTGCAWVPMFPALKFVNCIPGINVPQAMAFDCDEFLKECITELEEKTPLATYRDALIEYLQAHYPQKTYEDALLRIEPLNQYFPTLPLTSPITIKYFINEYSILPKELRHRLGIGFAHVPNYFYFAVDTLPLPVFFGRKLTLTWEPTPESQQIINYYGGLYQTPAYLIELKPTLWIGGIKTIEGEPTGPGGDKMFFFNIVTYDPNGRYNALLFNPIDWGATCAMIVNQNMADFYITNPIQDSLDIPTSIAKYLHKSLLDFALSSTKDETEIAKTLQVRNFHGTEMLFHQQTNDIWFAWNYPLKTVWSGLVFAGTVFVEPLPSGQNYGRDIFFFLVCLNGDSRIKQMLEQEYGILAFSTLKGMRVAYRLGVPIYQISDYGNTIIPYLGSPPGSAGGQIFPSFKTPRTPPLIGEDRGGGGREYARPNKTPNPVSVNELIIKLTKPIRKDQIIQSIPALQGAQVLKQSRYANAYLLKLPQSQNLKSTISNLKSNPLIEYAEPNYRYFIQSSPGLSVSLSPLLFSLAPNDPFFENQWGLRKCLFTAVWDSTTGDSSLILAILDTGVDTAHADLKNRILLGYDFANEDSFPVDDNGHGTQVCGVIGAQANNGAGIAGCDWQTKLLIIKCLDASGSASAFNIAEAIYYAVSHNARIINMSFGGYDYSQTIADAIQYAYHSNCVLIAAAGNDATSLPFYPASYPNVIGVSATKENDLIADFSNWGDYIDFAAPGVSIYTTNRGGGVITVSGTSFSCGFVSGAASLILSKDSTLTNAEVYDRLKQGAELTYSFSPPPRMGEDKGGGERRSMVPA